MTLALRRRADDLHGLHPSAWLPGSAARGMVGRPENMSDRPDARALDPFSAILGTVRIDRARYTRLEATAPWGFRFSGGKGQRVEFVLCVRGAAVLTFLGVRGALELASGDVYMLSDDEPYTLQSDVGAPLDAHCGDVERGRVGDVIHLGGGGAVTTLLSGSFALDAFEATPIRSILPRFFHLRLEPHGCRAFQSLLELLAAEVARPGLAGSFLISRLYEAMFVYAIRAYAADTAGRGDGWLAALSDPNLAEALRAMHAGLDRDWSVDALARRAGMSRSAFALRFKTVLGLTPLEYLTRWRMYQAAVMMRAGEPSLFEVATAVGYGSESAFSRVFKREIGVPPSDYRKRRAPVTDPRSASPQRNPA